MPRPVLAWSYSAITAYENCPYKFWATKVGKICSDVNQKNKDGADDHEAFEHYVGRGRRLPEHLVKYQPVLDKLKAAPGDKDRKSTRLNSSHPSISYAVFCLKKKKKKKTKKTNKKTKTAKG